MASFALQFYDHWGTLTAEGDGAGGHVCTGEAKEEEEDRLVYCIYCFILHAGFVFILFTVGQGIGDSGLGLFVNKQFSISHPKDHAMVCTLVLCSVTDVAVQGLLK